MIDWLHDCWFAAFAGDAPSFEAWPSLEGFYLHEYLLSLWGTPIGEMFDLERLAETYREKKRRTFFVSSQPANVPGKESYLIRKPVGIADCGKQVVLGRIRTLQRLFKLRILSIADIQRN